jgi:Bacterial cell division membrane protein
MPINRERNILSSIDWVTILLYLIMVVYGWFTIYGATYGYDNTDMLDISGRPTSQLMWICISVFVVFVIMMLDKGFFDVFAYAIYIGIILLLIVTIIFAPEIKGSRSWLVFGPVRIQPAEFAKFATALAVAKYMGQYSFKLNSLKNYTSVLFLILLPMACIILQNETGSALVYLAFFLVLYREGMSEKILLIGVCTIIYFITSLKFSDTIVGVTPLGELLISLMVLGIIYVLTLLQNKNKVANYIIGGVIAGALITGYVVSSFVNVNFYLITLGLIVALCCYLAYLSFHQWVLNHILVVLFAVFSLGFMYSVEYMFDKILEPHHQVRIKVSLGMIDDLSGIGYNVNQSKIAIGSGGLLGKGFMKGTQTKLKYVPEQETDFIFCTVGEEQGFVGSALLLILFCVFILRLLFLAERQETAFARIYGYGVTSIFLFHLVINIGMVLGLMPVIGIPLPFFSYGGSSFLGFTILLFILLRLDSSRTKR